MTWRIGFVAGALFALAACSGGNDGAGGTNGGGSLDITTGDITISEADARPIPLTAGNADASFRISGGVDAGLFEVDSDGLLYLRGYVSFETPRDSDGDNVYEVEITASAGGSSDTQLVRVTVANDPEGVDVRQVASFDMEVVAASTHDGERIVAASADGRVAQYDVASDTVMPLGTLAGIGGADARLLAIGTIDDDTTDRDEDYFIYAVTAASGGATAIRIYDSGVGARPTILDGPDFDGDDVVFASAYETLIGFGDGGEPALASDPAIRQGGLYNLVFEDDAYQLDDIAWGVRQPRVGYSERSPVILDRGEAFDELTDITRYGDNNLQWPYFDGFERTDFRGDIDDTDGRKLEPLLALALGTDVEQSQGWIGAAGIVDLVTDDADYMLVDRNGRVQVYNDWLAKEAEDKELAFDGFEDRSEDFAPDTGRFDAPVLVAMVDDMTNDDLLSIPMIVDRDGEIFRVFSTVE